jgi:hypothetical protein
MCKLPVGVSLSVSEGRTSGDHLRLVVVHVGPVLFKQFVAQCRGAGPVAMVTEELHPHKS